MVSTRVDPPSKVSRPSRPSRPSHTVIQIDDLEAGPSDLSLLEPVMPLTSQVPVRLTGDQPASSRPETEEVVVVARVKPPTRQKSSQQDTRKKCEEETIQ